MSLECGVSIATKRLVDDACKQTPRSSPVPRPTTRQTVKKKPRSSWGRHKHTTWMKEELGKPKWRTRRVNVWRQCRAKMPHPHPHPLPNREQHYQRENFKEKTYSYKGSGENTSGQRANRILLVFYQEIHRDENLSAKLNVVRVSSKKAKVTLLLLNMHFLLTTIGSP